MSHSIKLFAALALVATAAVANAQDTDLLTAACIPDEQFRVYCREQTAWDSDGDGRLSPAEAAAVKQIWVDKRGISSLAGIEYFTGLTALTCDGNLLSSLDVSRNTALTALWCNENLLSSLDVSRNTALTELMCWGNRLTSLDVSRNTALVMLDCGDNRIASLDVSRNTAMTWLFCYDNRLASLDVSPCAALNGLLCAGNMLSSLDISVCGALRWLDCSGNLLASLDVSRNTALEDLWCGGNPGDGVGAFRVKVWFGRAPEGVDFTLMAGWDYNGAAITPVFSAR